MDKARIVVLEEKTNHDFFTGSSCAFGVFDGVHRGHKYLIEHAIRTARPENKAIVLTFDIDPDELFAKDRLIKLQSNEERIEMLARSGVDIVALLPFTLEFAKQSPGEFLEWAFGGNTPSHIHIGNGFRFASKESGTAQDLAQWGSTRKMRVHEHHLLMHCGKPISATRIRKLLAEENHLVAEKMLGRKFPSNIPNVA